MLCNEDKEPCLQRKHDVCGCLVRSKIRLFKKEENNRNGSNVQEEITVEVDVRVERLVRLTNVVREDGDSRPVNREVLRKVEKVTEHGWQKTAGLVAEQVWEQILDKSESCKGTSKSKEQKKRGQGARSAQGRFFLASGSEQCVEGAEGGNLPGS